MNLQNLSIVGFGLCVAMLFAGCAPHASEISPSAISQTKYDGWSCQKLAKEKSFVDNALVRASADQDNAADRDAMMVFLIGVPTSGGGIRGEVARLKGEQQALHDAMRDGNCP